tara:strand:+ start:192 stop:407 length:216 start_codon:yes stop_codon:yes gene_type:complete
MYESENKKELESESQRIDLCGLWKNEGKNFFSGKVSEDLTIKAGEYISMFENTNQNPNAPVWNLVIYRREE